MNHLHFCVDMHCFSGEFLEKLKTDVEQPRSGRSTLVKPAAETEPAFRAHSAEHIHSSDTSLASSRSASPTQVTHLEPSLQSPGRPTILPKLNHSPSTVQTISGSLSSQQPLGVVDFDE